MGKSKFTLDSNEVIEVDFDVVAAKNKTNVKATKDGAMVDYIALKNIVLIGSGHDNALVTAIKKVKHSAGKITVDKGSILDKGELLVTGIKGNRAEFESAIKLFSREGNIQVEREGRTGTACVERQQGITD